MSNRYEVISAIKSDPADVEQIAAVVGDKITRKQIRDTLRDCVTAGLVERKQDHGLYYAITKKGVEWLKDQTGDYITAPARPETIADIVVPPKPDYDPDAVCFDAQKREAAKDAEIEKLRSQLEFAEAAMRSAESQRNAWREMAGMYGHETPVDLAGFIGEKIHAAESAEAALAMTIAGESAQESQELTGFIVALLDDDTPVFAAKEDARIAAIANAAATGLRASVLRLIDTAESVKVEWASNSKKAIES